MTPTLRDPVGQAEIAQRLDVQRKTVATWRARHEDPPAACVLTGTPLWEWTPVAEWYARHVAAERRQPAVVAPTASSGEADRVFSREVVAEADAAAEAVLTKIASCAHKKKRAVGGGAMYVCDDCGARL